MAILDKFTGVQNAKRNQENYRKKQQSFADAAAENNWSYLPGNTVYSPTLEEVGYFNDSLNMLYNETLKKNRKLTDDEVWDLMKAYDTNGYTDYETMYNEWYNQNYDTLFTPNAMAAAKATRVKTEVGALTDAIGFNPITQELNSMGLNADYARQLEALNQSTSAQYEASMNELARAENDMYRSIGMSQMQYERDIAKRRQQALKSGMSTAQLAAQEQANILAAQTGATQIAQNYMNQRYNTINSFAGKGAQNYAQVLANQINWNQNIATQNAANQVNYNSALMNLYGQTYAADKNYELGIDQTKLA